MAGRVNTIQTSLDLWPIGNCQVTGLMDERAGLVWGCVPRVDGDPVFCALLNGDRQDVGVWRFELEGQVSATQHYVRNTPILVTRLEASDGSAVEIRDFCPRFERSGRMYRPVAYVRTVRPVAGSPRLRVILRPMRGYGSEVAATTHGTNHVRYLVGDQAMRLSTDAPIGYVLEGRTYRVESDQHFFLGPDEPFSGNVRTEVRRMEDQTRRYWQLWVRGLATPLEWQDEVIRCAGWARSAWAMPPTARSNTIATARSCCRPCRPSSTAGCCAWPTSATSPAWRKWARWPGPCTTSPTPAFGSFARGRKCTLIPP